MTNQSLYVSTPIIQIEAADPDLMASFRRDVLQICIEESLDLPSMFTLVINNPYMPADDDTETWRYESIIQLGTLVKLGFIGSTTEAKDSSPSQGIIIVGEITAIETHFTHQTKAPILVRGYDISHRLHRGRHNRSFQNKTDSDLVKQLAAEVGIEATDETVKPSGDPHEYLFQENQSNMEFLRERAARIGFELFVQGQQMHFRPPKEGEILELQWLRDLESFRVRVTSAEQVSTVEVRGWDYRRQVNQEIVERAPRHASPPSVVRQQQTRNPQPQDRSHSYLPSFNRPSQTGADRLPSPHNRGEVITETEFGQGDRAAQFGENTPPPHLFVVDKPVFSNEEAERLATALWNEVGGEFVQADARAPGNPAIRVGKVVDLQNMGRYTGQYYVTETRHVHHEGTYTTEFSVRGLRGGTLLNLLNANQALKPSQTLMVGIVTHNHDPEGLGRVRVRFPTLTPERDGSAHSSYWARIVSVGAGEHRGLDCIPEINDEVLVGFEHGDIRRPYILGGLWNGKNRRPETVEDTVPKDGANRGKVRLRTLSTRTGHTLQFVEEDKGETKAGITLTTGKGHQLQLNDSDRTAILTTAHHHTLALDDQHQSIILTTASGQQIHLDDSTGAITINASQNISLNARGGITLNPGLGAQVSVPGIVRCQGLLTGSVIIQAGSTALDVAQALAPKNLVQAQTSGTQTSTQQSQNGLST
ncbi:MAG: phage baseplate assembly protein V [Cyanobacteria bacterium J06639_14]